MTEVSYEPVAPLPRAPSAVPAVRMVRRPRFQSFFIALGSIVVVYGVALGVMVGGAALVHLNFPTKHLNPFAAFHNIWVVGVLLGIAVLWLLPSYPWARRAIAPLPQRQPATTLTLPSFSGSFPVPKKTTHVAGSFTYTG